MKTLFFQESKFLFLCLCVIMVIAIAIRNLYIISWCLVVLCSLIYFYRIPENKLPNYSKNIITAPAYGRVVDIQTDEEFHKIVIYLNIFDVHVQWYPTHGTITDKIHKKGEFNLAYLLEKSQYNEKLTTKMKNELGEIRIDQIAGQLARRISNWGVMNTKVNRGTPMGMIKLSSRVDIYLPKNKVELLISKNTQVFGNISKIAKWI
jgi:phosphatidylserine decarboxylase